jgi:predicted RNA-binding protein
MKQGDPHEGVPLAPLVQQVEFIKQKEHWAHYLRSGIVKLPPSDARLIQETLQTGS